MERIFYYFFQAFDLLLVLLPKLIPAALVILFYIMGKSYSLKKITYRRSFSVTGTFEGEDVELIEEVTNRSFLPVFGIDIESLIDADLHFYGLKEQTDAKVQNFISRFTIMPFTTIRRTHKLQCLHRGVYKLEMAQMIFLKKVFVLPSEAMIYVYPKQLSFAYTHRLDCYLASMEPSRIPLFSDAFSFAGVREYLPGDSFHSINHKASARHGGQIYVNQNDYITSRRQMIYLNFETTSDYTTAVYRQYMETALSYCSYLLGHAWMQGYESGFAANCKLFHGEKYLRYPVRSSQTQGQYEEILQSMADVQIMRGQSIASLLWMDVADCLEHAELLILTLTMDERCKEAIRQLELLGNQVHIVWLDQI